MRGKIFLFIKQNNIYDYLDPRTMNSDLWAEASHLQWERRPRSQAASSGHEHSGSGEWCRCLLKQWNRQLHTITLCWHYPLHLQASGCKENTFHKYFTNTILLSSCGLTLIFAVFKIGHSFIFFISWENLCLFFQWKIIITQLKYFVSQNYSVLPWSMREVFLQISRNFFVWCLDLLLSHIFWKVEIHFHNQRQI